MAPSGSGESLLSYLCGRFSYLLKEQWLSCIEDGSLLLNGERAGPARALAAGDRLSFSPPSLREPPVPLRYGRAYEDEDYLIVDKPPLLPVHPSGIYFEHSLWSLLRKDGGDIHIITRLDRETSGLVLVAKSAAAARRAQEAQTSRALEKRYLAVTHGAFPSAIQQAEGWLSSDGGSQVRKKRRYSAERPAIAENQSGAPGGEAGPAKGCRREPPVESCATIFNALGAWQADDGPRSLVEARLLTGRTHQIRATVLALGYPILGDKLYGLDESCFLRFIAGTLDEDDERRLVLPYQALHCAFLSLSAGDGRSIRVEAPPPWPSSLGHGEAKLT